MLTCDWVLVWLYVVIDWYQMYKWFQVGVWGQGNRITQRGNRQYLYERFKIDTYRLKCFAAVLQRLMAEADRSLETLCSTVTA